MILATGGMGLVRAAYSAGKPAYGVGPGNAPCYIEPSADVHKAARDIVTGKTLRQRRALFVAELGGRRRADRRGGQARSSPPRAATSCRRREADAAGQGARHAAAAAQSGAGRQVGGLHRRSKSASRVPAGTRALHRRAQGRRPRLPALDREALPGALLLRRQATGAKAASAASRSCATAAWATPCRSTRRTRRSSSSSACTSRRTASCVNTPTTHGSIGLTTGLDPAMTLGCGGFGGNITSDNISPRHLLNIKRLAYGIREVPATESAGPPQTACRRRSRDAARGRRPSSRTCPRRRPSRSPEPVSAEALSSRIDQFLASRGVAKPGGGSRLRRLATAPGARAWRSRRRHQRRRPRHRSPSSAKTTCGMARREGRTHPRRTSAPSSRPPRETSAKQHHVFVWAGWRS